LGSSRGVRFLNGLQVSFPQFPYRDRTLTLPQIFLLNSFQHPSVNPYALQSALAGNPAFSGLASSLLNGVASQSYTSSNGTATPPQQSITSSLSSPLTFCSNLASFTSTLHSHGMTFTLFTSKGDIITRQVQTSFEQIAQEEKRRRQAGHAGGKKADLAFVEVDVDMPSGKLVADKYGVSDTPGYAFFKGDEVVSRLQWGRGMQADCFLGFNAWKDSVCGSPRSYQETDRGVCELVAYDL
jgi:hypothetical protein